MPKCSVGSTDHVCKFLPKRLSPVFWTPVNFEVEYFLNKETEGVLTDTVIDFYDQHLTWLSQLKPNAKVG